jgi:hypothetical protein
MKSIRCEAPQNAVFPYLTHFISLQSKYSPHSLYLFLYVRDPVTHPYRTTGKIMVLDILILTFIGSREDRRFWSE